MRKSSKDCRADRASVNSRIQAELESMIKGPQVMTFSARMPAYTYTGLCSEPKLRKPPGPGAEHLKGIKPIRTEKYV